MDTMTGSLIIDARDRLRWYQRLFSDATTAMMWGAWIWLWTPVLGSFSWVTHLGARSHLALSNLLAGTPGVSLERDVVALVGTSGTLIVWNRLPPTTRARPNVVHSLSDYARHFALPEQVILDGRRTSVCVVHHDEAGRIVRLECRTPACEAAQSAA